VGRGNDDSLVLTPAEARQLLRCSRGVLYSGLKTGRIPSIRISARKIVIPKQRFLEWLNGEGWQNPQQMVDTPIFPASVDRRPGGGSE